MDATLVTVTVLSMGMAAALSGIVWRMLRLERQRSNARVAALRTAAGVDAVEVAGVEEDLPLELAPAETPRLGDAGMFAADERPSPWGTRVAVMTALALIISSVVLFSLAVRGSTSTVTRGSAAGRATHAAPTASTGQLELMSLHDSWQTGSLTITGLVQNPRTGSPLTRVAVTAYTFDDHGSFLASGRALLDVTALEPGDESPFTVTVPVTDAVARYRIGFRDDSGRVIRHVDRRQPGPVAANW